jgi:hypothetical protein
MKYASFLSGKHPGNLGIIPSRQVVAWRIKDVHSHLTSHLTHFIFIQLIQLNFQLFYSSTPTMSTPVIVTGVQTGYTPGDPEYTMPQRLEWTDFEKDMDLVTLYVKGLAEMMAVSQDVSNPTGFFQIAGTHPPNHR